VLDGGVHSLFEVHEGLSAPERLADLFPRHDLACAAHEQFEQFEGLWLEPDDAAVLQELAGLRVELKNAESHEWSG
jgi:hypothetical protein